MDFVLSSKDEVMSEKMNLIKGLQSKDKQIQVGVMNFL